MFKRNTSKTTNYFKKLGILNQATNIIGAVAHKLKSSKLLNMNYMFKYSISIITIVLFSYVMIYADNFGGYTDLTSPSNWLTKIEIKNEWDGSITLDNIIIDQQQDDGGYLKIKYKVNPGEKISDIAKKFGVTSKNIRSVNKLSSDVLNAWQEIVITPVEGFVIENKLGDVSIANFAKHYGLDTKDLKELNDIVSDVEIIKKGYEIFIPLTLDEGLKVWLIDKATVDSIRSEPKPVTTTTVNATSNRNNSNLSTNTRTNAQVTRSSNTRATQAISKTSSKSYYSSMKWVETHWFYKWQCTAYVAMVRPDVAKAIRKAWWGNAKVRYSRAITAWLDTSKAPSVGSIGVLWSAYGAAWHVWVVISFDDDEVCLKNMNVRWRYIVSEDCFPRKSFIWYIK